MDIIQARAYIGEAIATQKINWDQSLEARKAISETKTSGIDAPIWNKYFELINKHIENEFKIIDEMFDSLPKISMFENTRKDLFNASTIASQNQASKLKKFYKKHHKFILYKATTHL